MFLRRSQKLEDTRKCCCSLTGKVNTDEAGEGNWSVCHQIRLSFCVWTQISMTTETANQFIPNLQSCLSQTATRLFKAIQMGCLWQAHISLPIAIPLWNTFREMLELQAKQNKEQLIKPKPRAKHWAAHRSTACHSSKQNAVHGKNVKRCAYQYVVAK